jgi:hypothetical protein
MRLVLAALFERTLQMFPNGNSEMIRATSGLFNLANSGPAEGEEMSEAAEAARKTC